MADMHDRFSWRNVRTQQHAEPVPGADVEQPVTVTLKEAFHGTTRLLIQQLASGQERPLEVKIPLGVDTGTRVRFTGYRLSGHAGGAPGDLYLLIEVRPCSGFERRGNDLYHQCEANLAELALGTEISVKTVDEKILALTIPPGTQPGQRFRLAGQGMPRLGKPHQHGDLYVTVNAKIPPDLAKLLEKIRRSQAPHDPTCREDDIFALLFLVVVFVAGIGVGFILYWLILD
jgi:curved DNA-binding protein